jgi:hypothetical protein
MGLLMEMYEAELERKGEPRPAPKLKLCFDPPLPHERHRNFKDVAELGIPSGDRDLPLDDEDPWT